MRKSGRMFQEQGEERSNDRNPKARGGQVDSVRVARLGGGGESGLPGSGSGPDCQDLFACTSISKILPTHTHTHTHTHIYLYIHLLKHALALYIFVN